MTSESIRRTNIESSWDVEGGGLALETGIATVELGGLTDSDRIVMSPIEDDDDFEYYDDDDEDSDDDDDDDGFYDDDDEDDDEYFEDDEAEDEEYYDDDEEDGVLSEDEEL